MCCSDDGRPPHTRLCFFSIQERKRKAQKSGGGGAAGLAVRKGAGAPTSGWGAAWRPGSPRACVRTGQADAMAAAKAKREEVKRLKVSVRIGGALDGGVTLCLSPRRPRRTHARPRSSPTNHTTSCRLCRMLGTVTHQQGVNGIMSPERANVHGQAHTAHGVQRHTTALPPARVSLAYTTICQFVIMYKKIFTGDAVARSYSVCRPRYASAPHRTPRRTPVPRAHL